MNCGLPDCKMYIQSFKTNVKLASQIPTNKNKNKKEFFKKLNVKGFVLQSSITVDQIKSQLSGD